MKRYLPLALLVLISVAAQAQQLPLYTQYIFNPYMINPAMVASSGRAEINAFYRNQWTGIENGPRTLQFDVQLPMNSKMAFGVNVGNDQTILLSATSVLLTYGYRVQLATDHTLGFGLSAGVFTNKVNLNGVPASDANDPALLSVKLNNSAIDGQFGAHYSFKNFTLGFAMINLFERKALSPEAFQSIKLSQLKNDIIFVTYKADIIRDILAIRPNFSYRMNENSPSFYEASALLSYKNFIDVGGGYRQSFGPSAMVRVNFGNIQAGFSYDFPSPTAQVSTGGSQEVQLKWRFGKVEKKSSAQPSQEIVSSVPRQETPPKEKSNPPKEESKPQQEPVQEESRPVVKEETPKVEPPVEKKQEPVVEQKPPVVEQKQPVVEQKQEPTPQTDHYLVIGTFEDRANAETFYNSVVKQGYKAEIRESKPGEIPRYYYVHLPAFQAKEISVDKILEIQKKTGFKDAWYKKVD